jgi:peptidyl-prolyl cis-trans isomerase B (cyclophilin B)
MRKSRLAGKIAFMLTACVVMAGCGSSGSGENGDKKAADESTSIEQTQTTLAADLDSSKDDPDSEDADSPKEDGASESEEDNSQEENVTADEADSSDDNAESGDYVEFDASTVPGAYDISGDDLTYVQMEIKDYGTVTMALDETIAPESVKNFVNLAESGFYDGLTFHRIISGFMIQGGDPEGNGTGGSDQNIKGEFSENGVDNPITHVRGAVSMARAMDPDSASSQFFIVHADSDFLDGQYAAFGYVTDGMDVIDKICESVVPVDNNGTVPAEDQPVITSVRVLG